VLRDIDFKGFVFAKYGLGDVTRERCLHALRSAANVIFELILWQIPCHNTIVTVSVI
jgi:hypothetical protein